MFCLKVSDFADFRHERSGLSPLKRNAWVFAYSANDSEYERGVYKLATPLTYTLSSVTVPSTVQGENNWWHDANGNITIEAIGTPISSDEPDALQSLNILLGGAYTPRANFSEPTDEQALNIILGR